MNEQISEAAREAARKKLVQHTDWSNPTNGESMGLLIQQLLNCALSEANKEIERLKRAIGYSGQNSMFRCAEDMAENTRQERDQLRAELAEAKKYIQHLSYSFSKPADQ